MMKTSITLAALALALLLQLVALPADARPIRCGNCGTVVRAESIWYEDRDGRYNRGDSGREGAVLGAIIGGLVGNQVGSGSGKKVATVAGAVAGGVAGNRIEKNRRDGDRYEVVVRMDNGRQLVLEQRELDGVQIGDRVMVSGGRARLL